MRLDGQDPHAVEQAAALLAAGELVRVLPDAETAPLEIFLVHSKRIGPSARLLRDFLLEAARGDSG